jgi:ABC-2 type transport system permease protein
MTALSYTLTDSATMLRRNLLHVARYPSLTGFIIGMPVIFLLLFVYVFGGTMGAGLGTPGGGRDVYLEYVVPGILIMTLAGATNGTAISVALDMTEGIVARFRTMSISRGAVLAGHVVAGVIQAMIAVVVVLGVAVLIGFRAPGGIAGIAAALGLLALAAFALTWLSVALGMVTRSVETASNLPMPLMLLPFLGSGFVPTDSMPGPIRWFADYQPFTAIIETLRALLGGAAIGSNGMLAIGWCVAISVLGYFWSRHLYEREPAA